MLCPEAPLVFLYTITSRLGLASYGQDHHETAHTLRDACQLRTCAGAQVSLVSLALFSSSRRSHRTSGNWQPTRKAHMRLFSEYPPCERVRVSTDEGLQQERRCRRDASRSLNQTQNCTPTTPPTTTSCFRCNKLVLILTRHTLARAGSANRPY